MKRIAVEIDLRKCILMTLLVLSSITSIHYIKHKVNINVFPMPLELKTVAKVLKPYT
jgi:hypothetical protein